MGRCRAPAALLPAPGSAHAHWFDRVVPAFVERFHVISLDQRGHGESQWAVPPAYATEDFAADLSAVMDELGWDRTVLAGHSMGGHNAMAFAAWHPGRVRGLVIVDSRPSIPEERLGRMLVIVDSRPSIPEERLGRMLVIVDSRPSIPEERLGRMRERGRRVLRRHPTVEAAVAAFRLLPRETVADPALLEHLALAGVTQRDGAWLYRFDPDSNRHRRPTDSWQLLGRIGAPTLIVRGQRSPILPPDMAEQMRRAIPRARVEEIPEAYHHLVLDAPEAFVRALETFLAGLH